MKIITIVGPTGVGKTKLSITLAKYYNAEIINGDSMQVYKKLDIGSAKPTENEKENIVHHLFDIADLNTNYTVFDYQLACRNKIAEIKKKGKNVIIVGGTGLYIKAALYDYTFIENTSYNSYDDLSNEELLEKIRSYKIVNPPHLHNRQRLVRLLNKLENEEPITNNKDKLLYDTIFIGIKAPREVLYERINNRVDEMFKSGLLDEVTSLESFYETSKALNTGIGYKEFVDYFNKTKTLEEVKDDIKKNSRRYAKRQFTFFNHQMPVVWFDVDFNNFSNTINKVIDYINNEEGENNVC